MPEEELFPTEEGNTFPFNETEYPLAGEADNE
jgi:hypothetical protein